MTKTILVRTRSLRAWSLIAAGLLCLPRTAPGADRFVGRFAFRTFGEEEGLTSPTPELLLQDHSGFLWVGTSDGLFRFDGLSFTRFGVEDGLPSPRVTALHETPNGRLYAGTKNGLARYDGLGFVALGTKAGLPEAPIGAISSDAAGTVYVGTPKGLFLSISDIFHVEARKDRLPERPVTALSVDGTGALLFSRDGVLYRREKGNVAEFGSAHGLPALERVDSTLTDGEGRLWVRTLDALYSLPPGGARFEREASVAPAAGWGRLALDPRGGLLVPTSQGLARREGGSWSVLTHRQGLPNDVVLSALVDREGSLFVGLNGAGLVQRPGTGAFTAFTREDGLPHEAVFAIAREKGPGGNGALWVGTADGLARMREDGTFSTFREKDGLGGNTVYALAAGPDGSIWAGSWPGGVTRFGPRPGDVKRYGAAGEAAFYVIALRARAGGEVWAGAATGAYRLGASGKFERAAAPGGEDPDTVYAFAEDAAGALYGAGRVGLQRLGDASGRRYRKRNGLRADFVSSMVGVNGGLLVAYREPLGLDRLTIEGDRLLISPFGGTAAEAAGSSRPSLPKRVAFVGRDAAGSLWVGGAGVDVCSGDAAASPAPAVHFGKADGLPTEEMSLNAFLGEADGTVWLGSAHGLIRYRPGRDDGPRPAPAVAFASCAAGARRLRTDRPAVLARHERNLRLVWAGLSFADARRLRYRYKVVGLDDTTSETALNEVQLKGLPVGSYRVEVTAVAPSGLASAKPAVFAFTITPAWWETWWARLGGIVLAVGAALGYASVRTRAVRAEAERLRDQLDLRTTEVHARERDLQESTLTDALTQVRNRRFFAAMIGSEVERSLRAYAPFAAPAERKSGDLVFTLIDVDRLKSVNDRLGNVAGDAVLLEVVKRLKVVVRSSDYLIRWGGGTFLVVTRSTARDQAQILAQRALAALSGEAFLLPGGQVERVTASIGWAPFPWFTEEPAEVQHEEVLRIADRALEAAKERGRNRAVGALSLTIRKEPASAASADTLPGVTGFALRLVVTEGPAPGSRGAA